MSRGNPNGASNSEVVCRWITGLDLTRRTEERWCINFDGISSAAEAALFEAPYELFDQQWAAVNARRAAENPPLPQLRANEAASLATRWLHQRSRPELRARMYGLARFIARSEEHTSELQSLMRISYAVFCLKTTTT